MTLRRATLYAGGATLLVAWFSSAASLSLNRAAARVHLPDSASAETDSIAADLQVQRGLLQQRLAAAPSPQQPFRNPFAFRPRVSPPPAAPRPTRVAAPAPATAPEPTLALIGVAERAQPDGPQRTALIATEGDQLILALVGDVVLQRYRVTAIGADVAELTDLHTGGVRRIALQ